MSKQIVVAERPEVIGPRGHPDPISAVQLSADATAAIDAWAEGHHVSRSEAIRRLVEIGLKAKTN